MFKLYLIVTGAIILVSALNVFSRTRDALHPAIFTSPLFLYFYVVWPMLIDRPGGLHDFFMVEELETVGALYMCCILALFMGMLNLPRGIPRNVSTGSYTEVGVFSIGLSRMVRKRLFALGVILGGVALSAYWYSIINVGGFVDAYSRIKGGGWAESGYLGEAPLLAYPAIALIALARQRLQFRSVDVLCIVIIASPHLIQGTFGGRRGPLFLVLAMLFISYFIAKARRPTLRAILFGIVSISMIVVLVWSQRQHLYIGSDDQFDISRVTEKIAPDTISTGDEYLAGVATVLTAMEIENYYWGYRYFVTFFIRPIPRQLWPTKYEDVGADWLYRYGDEEREERYLHAVGFTLLAGSSTGFLADIFYEFSWLSVGVSFILGKLFSLVWLRHRMRGGLWTILFLETLTLSIYLPTQSLTAFFHRFIFMGLITYLVWTYWMQPVLDKQRARRGESILRIDH